MWYYSKELEIEQIEHIYVFQLACTYLFATFHLRKNGLYCLLWCSLSSFICRWKGLSSGCCSSIKNIAVSLFFLSENFSGHSDSLLKAKVTHSKSSSPVIIGFFNSGQRSFLTFPFLIPVYRACKNRIFKKFASYRQSSSWVRSFCLKNISLTKKSRYDSFWVYEALQCSVKVDVESFSL